MEIRADTITSLGVASMTLSAAGLEERSTLGSVTCKRKFEGTVNLLCGAYTPKVRIAEKLAWLVGHIVSH